MGIGKGTTFVQNVIQGEEGGIQINSNVKSLDLKKEPPPLTTHVPTMGPLDPAVGCFKQYFFLGKRKKKQQREWTTIVNKTCQDDQKHITFLEMTQKNKY